MDGGRVSERIQRNFFCLNPQTSEYFTFTGHIKVLRLIADGCPVQNKNSIVITEISIWLLNHTPQTLESVELVFPITGHSFLPPDRVFGNVEQEIKKK